MCEQQVHFFTSVQSNNSHLASGLRLHHSSQVKLHRDIRGVMSKFLNLPPLSEPAGGCWGGGGVKKSRQLHCAGQQCMQAEGEIGGFSGLSRPPDWKGAFDVY